MRRLTESPIREVKIGDNIFASLYVANRINEEAVQTQNRLSRRDIFEEIVMQADVLAPFMCLVLWDVL